MSMAVKNNHLFDNFGSYRDEKPVFTRSDVGKDDIDLFNKSLDIQNSAINILSKHKL